MGARLVRFGEPAGRWVLLACVLGSALAFIDGTVVNIALPRIGAALDADAAGLQWTVNAYTLTLAAFILLAGSLGDRFGRRRVFLVGVAWFALGSLLCGVAPNIQTLVAARAIQGVGGALLSPGALAILQASFEPADRAKAIGAWSGLGGVAGAAGPFLGGWLVAGVQLASGLSDQPAAGGGGAAGRGQARTRVRRPRTRRAVWTCSGAVLCAAGLTGLTYAFTAWPEQGPGDGWVLGALLVGVVGLVGFVATEARSPHPMLPLEMFRSRTFSATNVVTFRVYAALAGVFFFVVINLQVVAGFSPLAAGMALLPVTVIMLVLSARAGALAGRIGPRLPMTLGPLVCAVGVLLLSRIGAQAVYSTDVLPAVIVLGLGLSLTVAPLTATALASAQDRHAGVASGVNNAVARTAGLLAIAILPLVSGLGSSFTDPLALGPAYRTSMLICAALLLAGGALSFATIPSSFAAISAQVAATQGVAQAPLVQSPCRVHCAVTGPAAAPEPRTRQHGVARDTPSSRTGVLQRCRSP